VIYFLKLDYAYGGRYEFMENGGGLWVRWRSWVRISKSPKFWIRGSIFHVLR
jgi:hypothetical protein